MVLTIFTVLTIPRNMPAVPRSLQVGGFLHVLLQKIHLVFLGVCCVSASWYPDALPRV